MDKCSNKRGGGSKAFWTMLKKPALFWKGGIPIPYHIKISMVHSKSDQDISGYNAEFEVFLYFYGESVFSIISIFCLMRFLYYRDLKCTKTFTRSWYCGWRRTPALQKHQTFPIHARQTPFCIFVFLNLYLHSKSTRPSQAMPGKHHFVFLSIF